MKYCSPTIVKPALDARKENVESRMGRRRREQSKPGFGETGPATGERFRLIRPRARARKRNGYEPPQLPLEPAIETSTPPSYVSGGVTGRARYLIDSMLRLTRDRSVIVLLLIVLVLFLIMRVLAKADSITQEALVVYRGTKEAQFAPVKLLVDVLDQFVATDAQSVLATGIFNRATQVLRRNAHMLDAAIRAVIPAAVPFAARFVQAFFV